MARPARPPTTPPTTAGVEGAAPPPEPAPELAVDEGAEPVPLATPDPPTPPPIAAVVLDGINDEDAVLEEEVWDCEEVPLRELDEA